MSQRQFYAIAELGEFQWLVDGARLTGRGHADDRRLYFITSGVCEVSRAGQVLGELGSGSAVGEFDLLLEEPAEVPSTSGVVTARGSVRCFVAPTWKVKEMLEQDQSMKGILDGLLAGSLASKLDSLNENVEIRNYKAVLEVACSLGNDVMFGAGVAAYRQRHGIQDATHAALLEEVPQCLHQSRRRAKPQVNE